MRLQAEIRPPEEVTGDRPYQLAAARKAWEKFDEGSQSTLVVLPTGTGKTRVAASMAKTARERGLRTLFLAHREVLIHQAYDTLSSQGLDCAIEMGSHDARVQDALFGQADAVIATVQTLQAGRLQSWNREHFGLIITDECHRAAAPSYRNVYSWFGGALHYGTTATPDGSSGQIGNIYQALAYHYPIRQAVLDGWLVPPRYERCKLAVDLKGLRATNGDFNASDLAERIGPMAGLIADAAKQRIGNRHAVVFTPDVATALSVAQALGARSPSGPGLAARYVAGESGRFGMRRAERESNLEAFANGEYQVIVCCDLLFEGWDCPHISSVVIARPTPLRYRYVQMKGRGDRLCPEKEDNLIVDFDWQTDAAARDLMTPVELFASEDPDLADLDAQGRSRVIAEARRLLERGETDPLAALDEAKDTIRRRESLPIILTGQKAIFDVEVSDPLEIAGLVGLPLKRKYDFAKPGYEQAKPYQAQKLRQLGVHDAEKLSFYGAAKLLRTLERRHKEGLADWGMVNRLVKCGIGEITARSVSSSQAARILEDTDAVV